MSDIDQDNKTMTFSKEALRVIDDMNHHVNNIGLWYGSDSDEFRVASNSLRNSIVTMIGLGGNITKDGPLSLYGISFIHYGVIWHGKHDKDYVGKDLHHGAPETGEWSVHS